MADNDYYNRLSEMNPGELADGLAMEAEFDAIGRGFAKLPTPHRDGHGFEGPVRVGEATSQDEAVNKGQLDAALGTAKQLEVSAYGDFKASAWSLLPSGAYLLFGTGSQLINSPFTLAAAKTYLFAVHHTIGDSLYADAVLMSSADDSAHPDLGREAWRVGQTLTSSLWRAAVLIGKNTLSNSGAGLGIVSSDNKGKPWVAVYAGNVKDNAVAVMGSLDGVATVGGHNQEMSEWRDLYLNANKNSFIGGRATYLEGPKSILQHPSLGYVKNLIPSIGSYNSVPNWFMSGSVLRAFSIQDLAMAASNGQTSQIDLAYIARFEFFVRVYIDAPSVSVWRHSYAFQISGCGLQGTNSNVSISYPFRFTAHSGLNMADIKHQFVLGSENNGCPYWEVHFPAGVNVQGAPDKVLGLSIRAVEMW